MSRAYQSLAGGFGAWIKTGIVVLAGVAVGIAVVRSFMLDAVEEMGWRMFWRAVGENGILNLSSDGLRMALTSATFFKVALGGLVGGGIAAWWIDRRGDDEE